MENAAMATSSVVGPAVPAVYMPNPGKSAKKRTGRANGYSLNEDNQPSRMGATSAERAASLGRIIDWLAPADRTHLRYQKTEKATFCNIYAHDYCYLAGVYLPRVWWKPAALDKLAAGSAVEPARETIREMLANDLVPWLKQYGDEFGWKAESSLTKLQNAANDGAVVLMAARARPSVHGHIVAVVPEIGDHKAKRRDNDVVTPLQSQAGGKNFNYGYLNPNWWPSRLYLEYGFWIHD